MSLGSYFLTQLHPTYAAGERRLYSQNSAKHVHARRWVVEGQQNGRTNGSPASCSPAASNITSSSSSAGAAGSQQESLVGTAAIHCLDDIEFP